MQCNIKERKYFQRNEREQSKWKKFWWKWTRRRGKSDRSSIKIKPRIGQKTDHERVQFRGCSIVTVANDQMKNWKFERWKRVGACVHKNTFHEISAFKNHQRYQRGYQRHLDFNSRSGSISRKRTEVFWKKNATLNLCVRDTYVSNQYKCWACEHFQRYQCSVPKMCGSCDPHERWQMTMAKKVFVSQSWMTKPRSGLTA